MVQRIALLLVVLALCACARPAPTPEARAFTAVPLPTYTPHPTFTPLPTYTPYPSPTEPPLPTATPTASIGTRKNPAPIGQSLTFDYGGASYAITITQIIAGPEAWRRIRAANMFNHPAKEGYEYVLFYVVAQITDGPEDEAVGIGESMIRMVDETGQIWSLGGVVNPEPEFGGTGFVGATIEGWCSTIRAVGQTVYLVFGMDSSGKGGIWFEVLA